MLRRDTGSIIGAIMSYELACSEVDAIAKTADDEAFNKATDRAYQALRAVLSCPVTTTDEAIAVAHFLFGDAFAALGIQAVTAADDQVLDHLAAAAKEILRTQ